MRGKEFQTEVRGVLSGEKGMLGRKEISKEGKVVKRKMSVVLVSWEEERDLIGENGLLRGEERCVM